MSLIVKLALNLKQELLVKFNNTESMHQCAFCYCGEDSVKNAKLKTVTKFKQVHSTHAV